MAGLVNATQNENLLWNIERTVTNVFIPLLNANGMGDKAGGFSITLFISVLQSRWSQNYLRPGARARAIAGVEIIFLINIFCSQFGGC